MTNPDQHSTPQRAGGLAVVAKYGRQYMSTIGKRGYETTVKRYFDGDRQAANAWLAQKGMYISDQTYARWGLQKFSNPGPHPAHINKSVRQADKGESYDKSQ